jgi:alpha 1,6-mannosyltransferase
VTPESRSLSLRLPRRSQLLQHLSHRICSSCLFTTMISSQPLLSRFLNYQTLLAACAIILCYNLWTFRDSDFSLTKHAPPVQEYNGIPKKLWYKLGPHGINDEIRGWTDTCIKNNPGYHVEFMTDESGDEWVKKAFAWRPDIVETYLGLTVPIFKADILRYLLLFDQGGIWSDLDVTCKGVPMDDWIPEQYKATADLVVGNTSGNSRVGP